MTGAELLGGEMIPADFVVVGGRNNTRYRARRECVGLVVDRGILVDGHPETGTVDVYATGDTMRIYSPIFKRQEEVMIFG